MYKVEQRLAHNVWIFRWDENTQKYQHIGSINLTDMPLHGIMQLVGDATEVYDLREALKEKI